MQPALELDVSTFEEISEFDGSISTFKTAPETFTETAGTSGSFFEAQVRSVRLCPSQNFSNLKPSLLFWFLCDS